MARLPGSGRATTDTRWTVEKSSTRAAIIKEYSDEYGTLTDDKAKTLVRRWLDTDIEMAKLFQLNRRISMMIDLQLTSQLPLAQSKD